MRHITTALRSPVAFSVLAGVVIGALFLVGTGADPIAAYGAFHEPGPGHLQHAVQSLSGSAEVKGGRDSRESERVSRHQSSVVSHQLTTDH